MGHIQGAARQHEKDYNTVLESAKPPVRQMKEPRVRNFEKMIKTMDHFERAKRELEIPLWTQFYANKLDNKRISHEEEQRTIHKSLYLEWMPNKTLKHRIEKILGDAATIAF